MPAASRVSDKTPDGDAQAQDPRGLRNVPPGHPRRTGHSHHPEMTTGERYAPKGARTVREGADGKGPEPRAPRRRPTSLVVRHHTGTDAPVDHHGDAGTGGEPGFRADAHAGCLEPIWTEGGTSRNMWSGTSWSRQPGDPGLQTGPLLTTLAALPLQHHPVVVDGAAGHVEVVVLCDQRREVFGETSRQTPPGRSRRGRRRRRSPRRCGSGRSGARR